MGMTNKQYQGFIRALKMITEKTLDQSKDKERTKEEILNDVEKLDRLLQDMLEDGN